MHPPRMTVAARCGRVYRTVVPVQLLSYSYTAER